MGGRESEFTDEGEGEGEGKLSQGQWRSQELMNIWRVRPSFIHAPAPAPGPWRVTGSGEVFAAGVVTQDGALRSTRGLHGRREEANRKSRPQLVH